MAANRVNNLEKLADLKKPLDNDDNYKKAVNLSDDETKAKLIHCNNSILTNIIKKKEKIRKVISISSILLVIFIIFFYLSYDNLIIPSFELTVLKFSNVGDVVNFGEFNEQKSEWTVLSKEDNRVLILYNGSDIQMPYNEIYEDVSWYGCTLKNWLNSEYYENSFVSIEKNHIIDTEKGQVFLLSVKEVESYFNSDSQRMLKGTANQNTSNNNLQWWLCSLENESTSAPIVNSEGAVDNSGSRVNFELNNVRPAMWIEISE